MLVTHSKCQAGSVPQGVALNVCCVQTVHRCFKYRQISCSLFRGLIETLLQAGAKGAARALYRTLFYNSNQVSTCRVELVISSNDLAGSPEARSVPSEKTEANSLKCSPLTSQLVIPPRLLVRRENEIKKCISRV